jgi:hypothetical protein
MRGIGPFWLAILVASLIANVALFVSPYKWENDKYPPREQRSQQTGEQQTETNNRSPAARIQIECEPNCAAQPADNGGHDPWWKEYLKKLRDDPIAGFTALLFIATLLLASIARNQVNDSRAIQRAHVFVLSPQSDFQTHNGSAIGLQVWLTWRNSGVTPASEITGMMGVSWVVPPSKFQFGDPSQGTVAESFVLGPGAEATTTRLGIGAVHILGNIEGKGQQFFWGWLRYRDIFPGSPDHIVEFCYRVILEGQFGTHGQRPRVSFAIHGQHNRYYDQPAKG